MKRLLAALLSLGCLLILLTPALAAGDAEKAVPYEIVVPLQYQKICEVNRQSFIERTGEAENWRYNLCTFDGRYLLKDELEIRFTPRNRSVVTVKRSGGWGVYSEEGVCLVPCRYNAVNVSGDQCLALSNGKYIRPGSWWGDRVIYDLNTRKITKEIGFGEEYCLWPSEKGTDLEGFHRNGTEEQVVGYGGQILLTVSDPCGVCFADSTSGILVVSWPSSFYYSPRGRLRFQSDNVLQPARNGQYVFESNRQEVGYRLRTSDGGVAIPYGVFDTIEGNDGFWANSDFCVDNYTMIVSKDGKYGVIHVPESPLQPSEWAEAEVAQALSAHLVDEDIQPWWRDSCTREEFCRMLMRTLEERTGKSAVELAVGLPAASFSHSDTAAVSEAAQLGIVKGTGKGRFMPRRFITREEAAVMLARAAAYLKIQGTGEPVEFTDAGQISDWAKDGVETVSAIVGGGSLPVMRGTQPGIFSPQGRYTVEQAAVTFYRLLGAA